MSSFHLFRKYGNSTFCAFVFLLPFLSVAQPGKLDVTFGIGGRVITNTTPEPNTRSVVIQNDGKILVSGLITNVSSSKVMLLRYKSDGSADSTFGLAGIVADDIGLHNDPVRALAIQDDGKIVIAGSFPKSALASSEFAVMRYNSDGSRDKTFGLDGISVTKVGKLGSIATSVAIQKDGKLVLSGFARESVSTVFALVRYNTDGSLDSSFGEGGIVTIRNGYYSKAYALSLQSDGKIVAAGESNGQFSVFRCAADGSIDSSFNFSGISGVIFDGTSVCRSLQIQIDGKILLGGFSVAPRLVPGAVDTSFIALARFLSDGRVDSTFDFDGKVTTNIDRNGAFLNAIVVQPDGRIIGVGSGGKADSAYAAVIRYFADGSLDGGFGVGGLVQTKFGVADGFKGVALQSDGKIVAAGSGVTNDPPDAGNRCILARYHTALNSGIREWQESTQTIQVYPNPAESQVFLSFLQPVRNARLRISNCLGQQVKQMDHVNGRFITLNIVDLPPGIFYLQLEEEGLTTGITRMIVQGR